MGLRGVSKIQRAEEVGFAKQTLRREISRDLLEEGDEQYVIVIHTAAVLADCVMVRVRWARDFLGVVQNPGIFTHNLRPLVKLYAWIGVSTYQSLYSGRNFRGERFVHGRQS